MKVRFLCMRTTAGRGRWEEARECEPVTGVVELHSDNSCANLGCKESHRISGGSARVKAKSLAEISMQGCEQGILRSRGNPEAIMQPNG